MKLYSTRNLNEVSNPKDAIIKGLASDGGLYCPKIEDILDKKFDIKDLLSNDYKTTAHLVFKTFFDDFTDEEINHCINAAYNDKNFDLGANSASVGANTASVGVNTASVEANSASVGANSASVEASSASVGANTASVGANACGARTTITNLSPHTNIAPISKIGDNYLMELYHGPTSAFKDVALTILPHFLTTAYKSKNENKKIYILTATSGDTGKAALSGFKDVENTFITVFYPTDGVSNIQKLQMQTSDGENVSVIAVKGDFDDCQRLVKEIYTDENIKKLCNDNNIVLSSANSINIGRLVPQIVYYIQSYIDLVNANEIKLNDKINFVVPTGNFGDILAGFIAKLLGTPINKLICASNDNNVLTDFINTGTYDRNRTLYKTISPSMDILISSNLERLLFLLSDNDDKLVKTFMDELSEKGKYTVPKDLLDKIKNNFVAYFATEDECRETIKYAFEKEKRIIDTHTAVAYHCLKKYQMQNSVGANNEIVGAKLCEPTVGANSDTVGADIIRPNVGATATSVGANTTSVGANTTSVGANTTSVGANACGARTTILSTASPYKFTRAVLKCICNDNIDTISDFDCIDKLHDITNEEIPKNLYELKNKKKRFDTVLTYDECKKFVIEKISK